MSCDNQITMLPLLLAAPCPAKICHRNLDAVHFFLLRAPSSKTLRSATLRRPINGSQLCEVNLTYILAGSLQSAAVRRSGKRQAGRRVAVGIRSRNLSLNYNIVGTFSIYLFRITCIG